MSSTPTATQSLVSEFHIVYVFLPRLAIAVLVMLIFWIVSKVAKTSTMAAARKMISARARNSELIPLLGSSVKTILLLIGVVTSLNMVGLDVTSLLFSMGVAGLAISFALRDSIAHLFAGILILWNRPIEIGDGVLITCPNNLDTYEGVVHSIGLRYTVIHSNSNGELNSRGVQRSDVHMIPNTVILASVLTRKDFDIDPMSESDDDQMDNVEIVNSEKQSLV
eukprot:TRINITY_DN386_c4_g1_i1.p1 TRINITY_DN386_c4_g1~~TRINITY_DN386_c4_g1_i1.p1  ORF type:complete len:238 (+),score=63.75 TRINITY_DN386_c4_g1_i1:48-716(+)